jgi:hypothetical protein
MRLWNGRVSGVGVGKSGLVRTVCINLASFWHTNIVRFESLILRKSVWDEFRGMGGASAPQFRSAIETLAQGMWG